MFTNQVTSRMFGRNPAWNTSVSSAARTLHPGCYSERSVALSPFPRIGLPAIAIATRSRSAQFASRIPPREIPLRLRDGSRAPIPPPRRNSSGICTYKIAELTPLESALVKKTRAPICLCRNRLKVSTFNYELSTRHNPFRIRTYTKRGEGVLAQKSTHRMSFCASTKSANI